MRRPVPLPTDGQAAEARPASGSRARDTAAPTVEHTDLGGPDLLPAPRSGRAARPSEGATGGSPTDRPAARDASGKVTPGRAAEQSETVGVREVWAAARARRKALRSEVRRFTVRQRRRRILWLSVVGALALLILGSIGAAYSPLFAVRQIRVVGAATLDPATVETALAGQLGTPLPLVDSSAVKAALVAFPLVESYTLEARPPHELVVRIVERTPIGSISSPAGYTLVDAAGVALSTTPEPPAGHPVITATGGIGSSAFAAIGTVFRALPDDIRAQVTAMTATTGNDVALTLGPGGTKVVWGNADESAYKAVVLATAMAARPPGEVSSYDVSAPDAVVMR